MTARYNLLLAALILSAASSSWAIIPGQGDLPQDNNNNNSQKVQVSGKEEEEEVVLAKPAFVIHDLPLAEEEALTTFSTMSPNHQDTVGQLSEETGLPLTELLRLIPHKKKQESNALWVLMDMNKLPRNYNPVGKKAQQILADSNRYESVDKGRVTLSTLQTETAEDATKILLNAFGNWLNKKSKK